ncbi:MULTISPECIES: TRAP transporter large permease [Hoeflea]|jgi:tripartite ATP-independent transporter DctM subunit|uniref:TRAP transporter large permease protein n=1 Tax=Hoeflea alexandrii TaxID=288436 RepID=A0ABT1CXS5_9HYPH|nr:MULTISPECIES: TRAP transporter large permease [Hoeflea]MCO6410345.1 TRAP transporter large permease subunit [Hoeflea alexandrii]MCY0152474.1 TRAP transporter large permease [Hoeflea alexandrii]VVT22205.1 Tripartite ATP-independent transporter DctM subunit [Hoeflea sp. EC-HK425]
MDPATIGLLGMALMLLLIFIHVPIGVAMGVSGVLTFGLIRGSFGPALSLFGTETVSKVASLELSVVPLFLLMGAFATFGGLSADLYRIAYAFIGHVRGGLAIATIGGCAGFGAICGSSIATATTMTRVALPEMMNRKYSERLATGSIAAGGTLGMLIPPSIILVLYGVLTEQFVKTLFVAALIPAVLAVGLHIVTIMILVRRNPALAPEGDVLPWSEGWKALKNGWAAVILMIVVTGGIYAGIFSVNESAAVGAFLAFVIAVARRRLSWRGFWAALRDTAATTSMIYLMIIGASIFTYAVTLSGLPEIIVNGIRDTGLPGIWVVILLMVMYLILGAIFDTISSMVITIPFVFPLILSYGYDPVWWGILTVMVIEIGMITPPIGMNVFVMKAMLPDTKLGTIYAGVGPFILADVIRLAILIAFPALSLMLVDFWDLPR